jgi:peptidyl-prolyl cis-trans isomerase A (cyclophilin A)
MGSWTVELYDELVPITVNNFVDLANAGFYNNLIFHRVIDGFMIQDGCPLGTGYGGPGYTITDEFHPDLVHDQAGILAMARTSAPNSAGSQYYITLAPQPHLNGGYAVFGKVLEGLENVLEIGHVPVNVANNKPLTPVTIDTLRILDLIIGDIFPADNLVIGNINESMVFVVEAYAYQSALHFEWSVDGVSQQNADSFIFEPVFTVSGDHVVHCRIYSTDWSHEVSWPVQIGTVGIESDAVSSVVSSLKIAPNPFQGTTTISYDLKQNTPVTINIYDLRGRRIRKQQIESTKSGINQWIWDGRNGADNRVAAGMYLIQIKADGFSRFKKCSVY